MQQSSKCSKVLLLCALFAVLRGTVAKPKKEGNGICESLPGICNPYDEKACKDWCKKKKPCTVTCGKVWFPKGLGLCAQEPVGGLAYPMDEEDIPPPIAYFPLTGGNLDSWPLPTYSGAATDINIVDDEMFGSVFNCSSERKTSIHLGNVPYGKTGNFTVSVFFKSASLDGSLYQHILSHNDERKGASDTVNTLKIYLPEERNRLHGLVRAILLDSTDTAGWVALDSDGLTSEDFRSGPTPKVVVTDGKWHMITVSTIGEGIRGVVMYIDGVEVAKLKGEDDFVTSVSEVARRPGGDAFNPTGALVLCARSDLSTSRFFDGSVAHLVIHDEVLSAQTVSNMHKRMTEKKSQKGAKEEEKGGSPLAKLQALLTSRSSRTG